MGANQSSTNTGHTGGSAAAIGVKTSFYELLGIDRQATDDEIKKAYRRRALELHPDRNYGDAERATALFAEVQSAYDVLADPQERAWYDAHETTILRGEEVDAQDTGAEERDLGFTSADDVTRLLARFHGRVEYSDAETGFYGFLRGVFDRLAREEEIAARREGVETPEYPSFGRKDDGYEVGVKKFYALWNGFATRKTFAWRDRYRQADAADRRMRRLIEKENRRSREEGVREFNDAVRSLVAFVRKRDPRYKPNNQSEAERQTVLREAAAAQAARSRAANAARMEEAAVGEGQVPEWATVREPQELEEESEEESEDEQYECVACKKTFKSEKQFEAHERSKKHMKAVQTLKRQLRKDGVDFELDEDQQDSGYDVDERDDEGTGQAPAPVAVHLDDHSQTNSEVQVNGQALCTPAASQTSLEESNVAYEETVMANISSSIEKLEVDRSGNDVHSEAFVESSHQGTDNSDENPCTKNAKAVIPKQHEYHEDASTRNDEHNEKPSGSPDEPKLGKAAQKRAKKAAKQESTNHPDHNQRCATCNATFSSKTRLFQHIKDFKHAAPVLKSVAKSGGKASKR